jgi:hypothetical protein
MEQTDYGEDVLILKKLREDNIYTNLKRTSKSLELEMDFLCKIERVLNQFSELV